jgi:hypothetical protein
MTTTANTRKVLGRCDTCAEWHPDFMPSLAYYWTHLGVMCDEHFAKYEVAFPDRG